MEVCYRDWRMETGCFGWSFTWLLEKIQKGSKKINPDCVIIGENWHDAYPYLQGDQYDSIMNYSFPRLDVTRFQVFTRINLPLSKPIIVYTALTSFTWPWSDFILLKLLLKEKDLYTVAVGLRSLDETEFARFAAWSVFIAVPIVILYFFLVKNMVNGMAQGAVKG